MRGAPLASMAFVVLATSISGCESNEPRKAALPPPPTFTMDEPATGPAVYLQGRREGERAVVDVIARGVTAALHGAAFRLHWDPSKLAFVEARGSDAWSRQAIRLAKEGAPGELVVAWTEKGGGRGIDLIDARILGSIVFTAKTDEGGLLEFRADRSTLHDAHGAPIAVEWRGGRVLAR